MNELRRETFSCEDIQNVELEESLFEDYWINFTIENCRYNVKVQGDYDGYTRVYHRTKRDDKNCSLCSGDFNMCSVLTQKSEELLNTLMEHPNVRLRWLLKQ